MSSGATGMISLSYLWVLENDGGIYLICYGSTTTWDSGNVDVIHIINHTSSIDEHTRHRYGLVVPYKIGLAQVVARPRIRMASIKCGFRIVTVWAKNIELVMQISTDGTNWKLGLDNGGIDTSPDWWDSGMIEYPYVFDHEEQRYMLYNGNGYGKTGFGLTTLE